MTEKDIKEGIYRVIRYYNIDHMPTSNQVRQSEEKGLSSAIERTGGYIKWAEKLNLSPSKPSTIWSEEKIEEYLLECINALDLNRMPSRAEIRGFYGNDALTNKISKTLGYYGWANKLGLEMKDSETNMGKTYEEIIEDILNNKGFETERMTTGEHFDILVNGIVKVDVKSASRYITDTYEMNTFGINKKYATCDIYILAALDEYYEIDKLLIIPSTVVKFSTTMSIGTESKYDKWNNRFDIIQKYTDFLKNVS